MDRRGVRDPDRELVEVGAGMEPGHADRRQGGLELRGPGRPAGRHVAQSVGPDRREVDRRREGQERLVRADVAGRLVPPDVLLARAHGHDERPPPLDVGRHADEPAGDLADERVGAGEDAQVRTAVLERDPERLALPRRDVGAVGSRRLEHGQPDRLDDRDEQGAGGVGEAADLGHRLEQARGRSGWAATTPATGWSVSASSRSRAARSVVPALRAVGQERDLVDVPAPRR